MADKPKPKRKTHTSSEVKTRYNKKTYKQYSLSLRNDSDSELIDLIERTILTHGISAGAAIKMLLQKGLDK